MAGDARDIPHPGTTPTSQLATLMRAREEVQRLLGITGTGLDMAVTWRQLQDQGFVHLRDNGSRTGGRVPGDLVVPGGVIVGGTDPTPDLTPPPDVVGFGAVAAISNVLASWTAHSAYTQGHGHKQVNIYAAKRNPGDANAVFADAQLVYEATDSLTIAAIPSDLNIRWHLWAKNETVDGVESINPVGGTNGVIVTTGQDVTHLLQVLTGQITEGQLYSALVGRINLIDGPDTLSGSVAQRVLAEATARGTAITSEATTRASADSAISATVTTLTATVAGNTAAIASEATTRATADTAISTSLTVLAASVANGTGSAFEGYQTWDFNGSAESWTSSGITVSTGAEAVTLTSTGTDPQFASPTISINGGRYDKVRARVKRTAGSGWDGTAYYSTAGHGFSGSFYKSVPDTTVTGSWVTLEWDMADLTAGGTDWLTSTTTAIRLDLGATSSDVFVVDWVTIGRRGSGVSVAAFAEEITTRASADSALTTSVTSLSSTVSSNFTTLSGSITSEATTRAGADTAMASDITTLTASVGTNSAAISSESTARAALDGSVHALYTLRVQTTAGGRTITGGFGLAATSTTGGGSEIEFGVRADRFYIGAPTSASGVGDVLPFVVQTSDEVVNGVTIPKGVYMDAAYIKNLTAMTARLGAAWIDNAMIANLSAAKLTVGDGTVGGNLKSTTFTSGSAGWIIRPDGTAEFGFAHIRGTLQAGQVAASYVTTTMLAASAVTAAKISVSSLDAITATIGLLRTASSGARQEIASNYIKVFDSSGVKRVQLGDLTA